MPTASIVLGILAVIFATIAALCGYVWWRVVTSPGDDNPLGGLAMLVAMIAGGLAFGFALIAMLLARRG
ncbi:MAG: hypothetical protein GQE15_43075 [Archangiaceae bacterium]|nr:hypothetical protein [Archangiaceae bacterium]